MTILKLFMALLIGISLSMDTFSLSLSYGTILPLKHIYILPLIVGIFHFIMPICGNFCRCLLNIDLLIDTKIFSSFIFLYLAINMIKGLNSENNISLTNRHLLIFALGVSIDSFGVGLTQNFNLIYPITYSLCSFIFTFLGLKLGIVANRYLGKISIIIGSIIMFIISIVNIVLL